MIFSDFRILLLRSRLVCCLEVQKHLEGQLKKFYSGTRMEPNAHYDRYTGFHS